MEIKERFKKLLWPLIYLALSITVIVTFSIGFTSQYFTPIYVSGSSMQPTLNEGLEPGWHHYGYIDTHEQAIKKIKRFNIITTYYPFASSGDYVGTYIPGGNNIESEHASFKIKRVYGLPGEYIKFTCENVGVNSYEIGFYTKTQPEAEWYKHDLPFDVKFKVEGLKNVSYYTYESNRPLAENEYFVRGDNYLVSADCYSETKATDTFKPIYFENIRGILVAIEGICSVTNSSGNEEGVVNSLDKYTKKPFAKPIYFI